MTSQKDQIQGLIAEIDSVLQKTTPRLPWVISGDVTQQRRVLEKVRNFLVALQRRSPTDDPAVRAEARPNLLAYDISYQPGQATVAPKTAYPAEATTQQAQQMLQAVVQEMGYLRSSLMQPLQAELDSLRRQRDTIAQELQQLEAQRQSNSAILAQPTAELLQLLMGRLQDTLPLQIAEAIKTAGVQPLPYGTPDAAVASSQADEMLINFDATLRIVFEALKRDMQAYQDSLAQGLDRMHTMGQQGEMMFSALISHLAQQLGRGASYLQVAQISELEAASPASPPVAPPPQAVARTVPPPPPGMAFPYPGIELASQSPPASGVDAAIDSWIRSVGAATPTPEPEAVEVTDLDLSDLNLEELDLSQTDSPDIDALLELEIADAAATPYPGSGLLDLAPPSAAAADATDLDAALKLLERLRHTQDSPEAATAPIASSLPLLPEDAQDEVDEFYESLFGSEVQTPDASVAEPAPPADVTLGWDTFDRPAAEMATPPDLADVPAGDRTEINHTEINHTEINRTEVPSIASGLSLETLFEPDDRAAPPNPASTTPVSNAAAPELPAFQLSAPEIPSRETDTIATLADLFDDQEPTAAIAAPDVSFELQAAAHQDEAALSPSAEWQDDRYIPAAPEEDLLAVEKQTASGQGLWLDDTVRDRLHEDLSNLEQGSRFPESTLNLDLPLAGWAEPPLQPRDRLADEQSSPTLEAAALPDGTLNSQAPETVDPALTLETMNLLFDEVPGSEIPTASDTPPFGFTQTLDDLFADAPVAGESLPTAISPPTEPTFTLEGMDDLFADVPAIPSAPTPTPPTSRPSPLPANPTVEPITFTLEGMDDLFADLPETTPPATADLPPADIMDLSLEAAFDFFADVPASEAAPPSDSEKKRGER